MVDLIYLTPVGPMAIFSFADGFGAFFTGLDFLSGLKVYDTMSGNKDIYFW